MSIVAGKRISRWPEEWQTWAERLPEHEREIVMLLAAYLDAQPAEKSA